MTMILEGTINGMRPVSGKVTQGKYAGTYWHFVSMEVCDARFGQTYSCQIRTTEKKLFDTYASIGPGKDKDGNDIEVSTLTKDLTGHNVRFLIKGLAAGERTVGDKNSGNEETILQVRCFIAGLKDLGLPKDDDF